VRRGALVCGVALLTQGCVTRYWQPVHQPVASAAGAQPTARYRLRLADGRVLDLEGLRVAGDSVRGARRGGTSSAADVAVAITDIAEIERWDLDGPTTVRRTLRWIGAAAAIGVVYVLVRFARET
jgi:hypothetical protein